MTKGRLALPLGVMAVMTSSETLFIPGETCRRQVRLLLMTPGGFSAAPPALGSSSIGFPALPGWADVWQSALRASHPWQPLPCHFSLYLPQASRVARDDKGDGGAAIGCDGCNDNPPDAVHSFDATSLNQKIEIEANPVVHDGLPQSQVVSSCNRWLRLPVSR